MGRKRKLDQQPGVKAKIDELAQNKALTQEQITQAANAYAEAVGEAPVGKSTVNRYLMSFNEVMQKREESTLVVKQWINRMGDIPDGDYGRAMVEILRTLSFDLSIAASQKGLGDDLPGTVKMVKDLSMMVERVERAATINEKRVQVIEKSATEKAMQRAVDQAIATAKQAGVSKETRDKIRREVLGMA